MNFTVDIDILVSRDKAIEIFMDRDLSKHWQDGFVKFDILAGQPGQNGASVQLKRKVGKQLSTVIETLENNSLPNEITFTYSAPQMWCRSKNSFIQSAPNKTTWIREHEYKCTGIHQVLNLLAPGRLKKQTAKEMEVFKRFCEGKVYSNVVF